MTLNHASHIVSSSTSPFASANTSNRFDLNENLRGCEASDFNQRRTRKIAVKKLLPGAPYFGVVLDVYDKNSDFDDVRHGTPCRTRQRILPKINFACSYSSRPSIVLPSLARETVPEMKSMSPTRNAFDHRPGGGSATWGLVTLSIFMLSSHILSCYSN
jgi:hypothetical protein